MTMNPGTKAKRAGMRPQRRKIRAPRTFAKVSTATARRALNRLQIKVEVCKELKAWVNEPLPPQTVVLMKGLVDAFVDGFHKGFACAKMQDAIDAIDDHLEKYGDQLSAEDYDKFNKDGEELWEGMGELGCFGKV